MLELEDGPIVVVGSSYENARVSSSTRSCRYWAGTTSLMANRIEITVGLGARDSGGGCLFGRGPGRSLCSKDLEVYAEGLETCDSSIPFGNGIFGGTGGRRCTQEGGKLDIRCLDIIGCRKRGIPSLTDSCDSGTGCADRSLAGLESSKAVDERMEPNELLLEATAA